MENNAELLQPEASAKDIASEVAKDADKNAREVAYPVLDMEGNEWAWRRMVTEALTVIKYKKEGERQPAITLRQDGGRNSELIVISINKERVRKKVLYGKDGKIRSIEDVDLKMQKNGVYQFGELPQNINIRKTANMFLEGFRLLKGELPVLVSAAGSKPMGVESKPAEPQTKESKPMLRTAA